MPILTEGWHQFRHFYHVTTNPLMSYTYLGNSIFQIKIFNGSTPKNEYPRYHRLTTSTLKDLTFDVDMPDRDPISSKLVNIISCNILCNNGEIALLHINILLTSFLPFQILPHDLGNFLRVKYHDNLRLCDTSNTISICKLIFKQDVEVNTTIVMIGHGWKSFCKNNRIYPESLLEFKCDSIMAKNIVSVYKVSRHY